MEINFVYPQMLLLLFILPLFILIYFSSLYYYKKKAIKFPNFEAMQRIFGVEIFSRNFISLYINLFILALLIFSLAGAIVSYDGRAAFVLGIDNSDSMKTQDVLPNRLDAAKLAAEDFVKSFSGGAFAVVSFAGKTNVLQEPDASAARTYLTISQIDFGSGGGTNIEEIVYSTNFILEGYDKKYLVLISDGQVEGDLNRTIQYAKDNGIIIYPIAVGTLTGGLTENGVVSKVDEVTLQNLAFSTGGQYSRSEDLSSIEQSLSEISLDSNTKISLNISFYLLLAAITLFSINWIFNNFRFRTFP